MPFPELRSSEADACRAVLLHWVEPEGAVIRSDAAWVAGVSDPLRIVVALAFSRPKLLPKGCTDTRSAWRRLNFDQRIAVDAAARVSWPYWMNASRANDDTAMGPRPYGGDDTVLGADSAEAAACRAVLAGSKPDQVGKRADAGTATVVGLAFGQPRLLPEQTFGFRGAWQQLDRRQRRLIDAAARAAWPARGEPHVEGWW